MRRTLQQKILAIDREIKERRRKEEHHRNMVCELKPFTDMQSRSLRSNHARLEREQREAIDQLYRDRQQLLGGAIAQVPKKGSEG